MTNETEIYSDLTEIFRDVFMRGDLVLRPDTTALDVEGWDSFKQIEIIMAAEEKWHIRFTSREFDNLQRVGDLIRMIAAKTMK